jgi:hypothetical protein
LAECQPFSHYWQVVPDPGGQCRQGYAQLITMATCNVITDLLLVIFPIPIILNSHMNVKRKVQLVLLFSLSLGVVGVTLYRVPIILRNNGRQQTRSLLASIELLFATAAANALVLGSFVRDRGVKKRKYKFGSTADSIDRSSGSRSRRPTMNRHWGSDEDLVRDLGLGVNPELRNAPESPSAMEAGTFRPAPVMSPGGEMDGWHFPNRRASGAPSDASNPNKDRRPAASRSNSNLSPRRVSFFDVGGLLGDSVREASLTPQPTAANQDPPSSAVPAGANGLRRGSTALLQDLGGLLSSPLGSKPRSKSVSASTQKLPPTKGATELEPLPKENRPSTPVRMDSSAADMVLADPGGLLSREK